MTRSVLCLAAILALAPLATEAAPDLVAGLGWMGGTWTTLQGKTIVQEAWLAPHGGQMAGVSQASTPGARTEVEFMTISRETAGVTFTARISGQPPTPFVLKPGVAGTATFENLAHDFPQRIIYRRCGKDLCARIEGLIDGKLQGQNWHYTRFAP